MTSTSAATRRLNVVPADQLETVNIPAQGDEWWRSAVIYQIYPRSFADESGDGVGDLPGITKRLPHVQALGVDAVWLSPFYLSPQHDGGYDVADYRLVDPLFGTNADFDELLARAHELGLRVFIDLVPNHTSSEHEWFKAAIAAAPGAPERDRYIFRDGKGENGELPPNNWTSIFHGPAWSRETLADGTPGQWYLHLFDTTQPDLNWENPEVRAEVADILRFWLDKGVDGFRIDVAHAMVKAPGLPDWGGPAAMIDGSEDESKDVEGANEGPAFDQEGVHEIYRQWHQVLAEYDGDRAMVVEAWVGNLNRLARYLRADEAHQAFNFHFLATEWQAPLLRDAIATSMAANDKVQAPTTWVMSNHDVVRLTSRLGLEQPGTRPKGIGADDPQPNEALGLIRARAAALLTLGLPGSAYLYQGEELGLPEATQLPHDVRQDPAFFRSHGEEVGRDGCRVPLPWEAAAPSYGYSSAGKSWLPQPDSWARYAADQQVGVVGSTYELHREILRVRKQENLANGQIRWADQNSEDVLAFWNQQVLSVINFADTPLEVPGNWEVLVSSSPDNQHSADAVVVAPHSGVWLKVAAK